MKHDTKFLPYGSGLLFLALAANANPVPNRFATIASENAFRLNPQKPEIVPIIRHVERPRITLQGVTTILGRPQVLLNIQKPAKPGEIPEISCILAEGESQYEVVVLKIEMSTGTVRLNNNGVEQAFSLK